MHKGGGVMVVREETASQWPRASVVALIVLAFAGLIQPWYAAGEGMARVSCTGLDLFGCAGGMLIGASLAVALVAGALDVLWHVGDAPQWVVRGALSLALLGTLLIDPSASLPSLWQGAEPGMQGGWFVTAGGSILALVISSTLSSAGGVHRLPKKAASRRSTPVAASSNPPSPRAVWGK